MRVAALAVLFLLMGCAAKPAPEIVTKEVKVLVPVPCNTDVGERPHLMTRAELWTALSAAQDTDERTKIVTSQLLAYMGWLPVVETGLKGCKGPIPK